MFDDKIVIKSDNIENISNITKEELKDLDDHFFSWIDLPKKERKITEIFRKHKSKFSEENKALFLLPIGHVYEIEEFRIFFDYEKRIPLPIKKEYNFVYDCLNFVCYEHNYESALKQDEYVNKILYDFSLLNEKGTLMILLDVYYAKFFFENLIKALGSDYKNKLFINFYFMEKYDFLFVITIQKMARVDSPINVNETKVLITDFFSNILPHLIGSKSVSDMKTFLDESFSKMRHYYMQCKLNFSLLKELHPGKYLEIRLKTSPLSEGIDYIVEVTDNSTNIDCSNNKTMAVVILYEMSQELTFQSNNSFDMMTKMLNVGRIITLECALLNPMNMKEIAFELNEEIEMMKPSSFKDNVNVQGWEDNNPKYLVYQGDNFLIRDCEEKPDLFFRQLFYSTDNHLLNAIMAKIKIKFVSKSKIKNNDKDSWIYPVETQDKFKNKGVIKCIDENILPGFYEKTIIYMAFYLDLGKLPKNTIKIMDIGAGLGIMSFYLYKFYKGNCEMDNIEKNKWMYDIGVKYFGLKNYDKHGNRINWFLEDAEICINKMITSSSHNNDKYENKIEFYDYIFNEINDINLKELCSPSKHFFTDEFLSNIKKLLNKNGLYLINVQTRSFKILYENYLQIAKHFPTLYTIPSENRLTYIFICFKEKINEEKFVELFSKNNEIIMKNSFVDTTLVEPFYKEVISKIKDFQEEVKNIEENSHKL